MSTTTRGRVNVLKYPKYGFELAAKIDQKHLVDAKTSELNNLDGVSWDIVGPTIVAGLAHNAEAKRLKGLMEAKYKLRDAAFILVDDINRAPTTYLKDKYTKNQMVDRMGLWR